MDLRISVYFHQIVPIRFKIKWYIFSVSITACIRSNFNSQKVHEDFMLIILIRYAYDKYLKKGLSLKGGVAFKINDFYMVSWGVGSLECG